MQTLIGSRGGFVCTAPHLPSSSRIANGLQIRAGASKYKDLLADHTGRPNDPFTSVHFMVSLGLTTAGLGQIGDSYNSGELAPMVLVGKKTVLLYLPAPRAAI